MKVFSDNLQPIEIELVDNDGNKTQKKGRYLKIKDLKELDKIRDTAKEAEGNFDILCKQIAFVFGGNFKEYTNYSFPLLKSVMDYVKEIYLINPIVAAQEK